MLWRQSRSYRRLSTRKLFWQNPNNPIKSSKSLQLSLLLVGLLTHIFLPHAQLSRMFLSYYTGHNCNRTIYCRYISVYNTYSSGYVIILGSMFAFPVCLLNYIRREILKCAPDATCIYIKENVNGRQTASAIQNYFNEVIDCFYT